MSARLLTCAAFGLMLAAGPAAADPPKPGTTEHTLAALRQPVTLDRIEDFSLLELLQSLGEKYNLTFTIRDEAFKQIGYMNIREERTGAILTRVKGMSLHRFLSMYLEGRSATYLVRKDCIEITTIFAAVKEAKC